MMVADSDLLIDFLRRREPGVARMRIEIGTGRLATTAINAFELLSGAHSEREKKSVETLLAALQVLPIDSAASALAAEARLSLERKGLGIGLADYLIAGVCLARTATLLTRNRSHFERVPGLRLGCRRTNSLDSSGSPHFVSTTETFAGKADAMADAARPPRL